VIGTIGPAIHSKYLQILLARLCPPMSRHKILLYHRLDEPQNSTSSSSVEILMRMIAADRKTSKRYQRSGGSSTIVPFTSFPVSQPVQSVRFAATASLTYT